MIEKTDFNIEYAHIYGKEIDPNNILTDEHIKSIIETKRIIKELKSSDKTYSLCILVDDYNESIEIENSSIFQALLNQGLAPDYIVRESQMVSGAEFLMNILPTKFKITSHEEIGFVAETDDLHLWAHINNPETRSFKEILLDSVMGRENKEQDEPQEKVIMKRLTMKSRTEITLQYQDKQELKYSCPLMTAAWHLMRLGVKPFYNYNGLIKSFHNSKNDFIGERLITILPIEYLKVEGTALELLSLAKTKTINKQKKRMEYIFF